MGQFSKIAVTIAVEAAMSLLEISRIDMPCG
jgi:hypothetical protein